MRWLTPADAALAAGLIVLCGGYAASARRWNGLQRRVRRRWPGWRLACFLGAAVAGYSAFSSAAERLADSAFAAHMAQHLVIILVLAPLFLLSAPMLLLMTTIGASPRRRLSGVLHGPAVALLSHPLVGWCALLVVLWLTHFSGLYEAALDHPPVHALEHAAYLGAAMLFWYPVVAAEPSRWRMGYPLRMLYLFAFVPQAAFLGAILEQTRRVLYAHYALLPGHDQAWALVDQQNGGVMMWLCGGAAALLALLLTAAAWARSERGPASGFLEKVPLR
ncbi:MAG: cytochrome c oxidase assembly protein [Candidatus Eremiobacteraeota bacterium]|nr:cytochrome c oxidase assembly protein [Candidatus Eremiobacteraeota bacterium]